MNWQEKLINKANELKIKGGELYDIVSSRDSNRDNIGGSRDIGNSISTKNRKDINDVKREEDKLMITREAALDDLKKLEAEVQDGVGKVMIKVAVILVKMLATIRSNQLLTDADKVSIKAAREARKSKEQQ